MYNAKMFAIFPKPSVWLRKTESVQINYIAYVQKMFKDFFAKLRMLYLLFFGISNGNKFWHLMIWNDKNDTLESTL